jgi:hypothetical protein
MGRGAISRSLERTDPASRRDDQSLAASSSLIPVKVMFGRNAQF